MPFTTLNQSGKWCITISFESPAHYLMWQAQTNEIKNFIAAINDDGNAGAARVPRYHQWLNFVNAFVERNGEALLPPDIKDAVNEVESYVGVQPTVWEDPPENHLVTDYLQMIRRHIQH